MLQIMASKILFVFGAFICFAALVTSDNYTELEISSKTTQKTIWQGSQTFHRMIIGMTDIDFGPNGKASAHLKTLRSFASKICRIFGGRRCLYVDHIGIYWRRKSTRFA